MASVPEAHVHMAVEALGKALPDDITSIHDYGARLPSAAAAWSKHFPDASLRLFDADKPNLEYGDVTDPLHDADLIAVLHVFESNMVGDPEVAIQRLLGRCKYLLISVHRHATNVNAPALQPQLFATTATDVACNAKGIHDIVLLRGRL